MISKVGLVFGLLCALSTVSCQPVIQISDSESENDDTPTHQFVAPAVATPEPPCLFLTQAYTGSYVGTIKLGLNRQKLQVLFDTSNGILWVPSTLSDKWEGKPKYDHHSVTSATDLNTTFFATHGSGYIAGVMVMDFIQLDFGNTYGGFVLGAATHLNTTNTQASLHGGVLGLGLKVNSQQFTATVLEQMQAIGVVQQMYFSLRFCHFGATAVKEGQLVFGAFCDAHFKGSIFFAKIITQEAWSIWIHNVWLGSHPLLSSPLAAVVDVALPYITGPSALLELIHQNIEHKKLPNGRIRIPCQIVRHLPTIHFDIREVSLDLPGPDQITEQIDKEGGKEWTHCYSVFRFTGATYWHLGHPFFQPFFTVFDREHHRIGFAAVNC